MMVHQESMVIMDGCNGAPGVDVDRFNVSDECGGAARPDGYDGHPWTVGYDGRDGYDGAPGNYNYDGAPRANGYKEKDAHPSLPLCPSSPDAQGCPPIATGAPS